MKKIFNFAKKKKSSTGTPDNGSVLSVGYELKDKDLGKVHKAASVGDLAKLKQLATKQKNDLNQLDKENRTALHIACAAGHVEVVQFLVESKAKLNLCDNQIRSALMKAVQGQHESCINILLENHADPNLVDINGNTALHLAASIPSVSTAGLLLEHEANINAPNKEGLTPLTVAVREDHNEMAEFLLKEGADVNATDDNKRSPLMMAAGNGQYDMLQLLLRYEADITQKDDRGWSADDYAINNGHHACSHLIDNHATQKSDGTSLLHQDQGKSKKKLSGASQRAEASFSLGGPAIDKDEQGENQAGGDFEDISQSESVSRVSKSGADDWPSSDNDDESPMIQKKPKKFNLRQMFASKAGGASAQLDTSLSGVESEPEPELVPQTAPPLPKALPSTSAPSNPVDPHPETLPFKPPRMSSTPLSSYNKKEISTDDDSQTEDLEEQGEEEESEEEEEEPEESDHSHDAASTIPETDTSKDKKRDFMSELGLKKDEPVQDSLDSESDLDDVNLLHEKKENKTVNQEEAPTGKENEDEINSSEVTHDQDKEDQGESLPKETEKAKWEPLLNKLDGVPDQKTDLMEELGLGDADDLADASDWDSASTTSKHTLPGGRRMPSPGIEEFPESPEPPKTAEVPKAAPPVTPQRSFNSRSASTASPSAPHPLPRARKITPSKSDSQDESDWDSDRQSDNHMMETVYQEALDQADSPEPNAARTECPEETVEQEEEEPVARKNITIETAAEEQRLSTSQEQSPTQNVGSGKPEPGRGFREELTEQTPPQEHKPVASKRTNGAPAQSFCPQMHRSRRQHPQDAQEPRAQGFRHVNGNPLSVFDDSSLSDVSEDEGRMPKQVQKNEHSEEVEMAEDFDDLTQSSDTATDDLDSPSAGYRHAALLVDKLDSTSLDSRNMVKLQNIFHEYERTIQKLKSRHSYLSDKVNQLEMERVDMKNSLEEIKEVKSTLERNQLELQTEVTNLKFQLKQEQENRRNATMMYNTTKDKLKRTEEQQQLEVQEKQKVELTLRNLELEMRTLVNNMKQLEEDHSETQRLLAQERSARALQENLLNGHLRKQQEIEAENKRNISKSNEALSQLTEASDRERELLQQTSSLQEQISILRADLERSQANSSLKESHLLEENETLKEQLEDSRREVKANSEALTQTVFNCNNQLTTLKSELAITTNRFENEKQARETLEKEVESTRTRLTGAVQEAERCMAATADTEKALLREKEESQRLKDRLTAEGASHREAVSTLTQKLSKAEAQANSLENEVHRVTLQLTEKGLLLDVLQKEKDALGAKVKDLDKALQTQKELATKTGARHEATQERLAQAQSEGMLLRQQLEEANNKGDAKEKAVTHAQERFSDMLSKLRSDCEERVQLVEERNKELASKAADLRDQVYKLEEEKNDRETNLRQLQQELADSLKKLSMSEASLEVNTRYRNDLEEEKARILRDSDRLREKLAESEDQYVQAEKRYNSLKSNFDDAEKELAITAQRLQEALSASAASAATIKQLEEAVQRLEIENAKLEAAAKQQSNKIEALQKGAQEAALLSDWSPEDGVQRQSMLSHTAQDSQALWEQEVKSRSKLGLRLSELEKEKGELTSQIEIEKKKVKKISEQKKAADARLDQEISRNSDLQKEMYRLRTLLKTAKKKMRDQDMGAEFNSPMNSLRMEMSRLNQDPRKADDLQVQLDRESLRRSQLEKENSDLREELASLKHSGQNRQRTEEELQELRRQIEGAQREQSQAEERARHELQHKLEQVNLFLQTQAASQEALDQIKAANQASVQSQLEQRIRELEAEVSRARSTQQDSLSLRESTRSELDRYRGMYAEELRLRKSLAAKLERANTRLSDAKSKLLSERSKSLISGSLVNSSALGGSLGSSPGPLGLDRSLGLSLLSPVSPGHSRGVEDYLAKMRSELDRNISKELRSATAELEVASARLSPVGSATLDPVTRATQDYLTVLKKNYNI
ncbi:LOW QUALITY PROTEIN: ankyrin repeat domain-containing protein 26 [Boleophthalmus pectinirostris]|uniref:LOW QUALITY PROTEIN: ankyrin repeat domain-containing protein 26 n=1 Tax=Boleophthalmus pectinirostris TaxID=150288 RepID=UPI00242C7BD2|nr:LOW QUALITY PROTEIN: ankyrin repeat domain-containing protein 26 [Boleophthalmus pectinirostris]